MKIVDLLNGSIGKAKRYLLFPIFGILLAVAALGCKKGKLQAGNKMPTEWAAIVEKKRTCNQKELRNTMNFVTPTEFYHLLKKAGMGKELSSEAKRDPVDLQKINPENAAVALGIASAEIAMSLTELTPRKAVEQMERIRDIASQQQLLDQESLKKINEWLTIGKALQNVLGIEPYLSVMQSEMLKKMNEPQHRFNALQFIAGGALFSYYAIAKIAVVSGKIHPKVQDILNQKEMLDFLTFELNECFPAHANKRAKKIIHRSLKQVLDILRKKAGTPLTKETLQSIIASTEPSLKKLRSTTQP